MEQNGRESLSIWQLEEYEAGTAMVISDYFRIFDNMEEGVKGYFELLQIPRYQNLKGITEPGRYLETICRWVCDQFRLCAEKYGTD